MQAKSCLTLKNYIVKTINFSINEDFEFPENEPIKITPTFRRDIHKIDDDNVVVDLIFLIDNNNNDMPFSVHADIQGMFNLEKWEQPDQLPLITGNAVAILFPYLRTLVSMVTANANITPYVLPVMNIAAMFEQSKDSEEPTEEVNE